MTIPQEAPTLEHHPQINSMLARHLRKEIVNYYSSSPLNRLSFLRTDHTFLSIAVKHPASRFLLFDNLAPLASSPSALYYARYDEVKNYVPPNIFDKSEKEAIRGYDSRQTAPHLVFLGLDESKKTDGLSWKIYTGAPYFALDVTPRGSDEQQAGAKQVLKHMEAKGLAFHKSRIVTELSADDAAIFAQSRHLLDWNIRNTFCGTCGHKTLATNAGTKRVCPPADAARAANGLPVELPACGTRTSISNLTFPRTDPTIIVAVMSFDGKRILLGRSKSFPPGWYSTLAGFIEPGESIEDAVRREVWEESGVTLSQVILHSSQPWPYPSSLMIGAIAQVTDPAHEKICLDHDPELEDARWFEIDEVEEALRLRTSPLGEAAPPDYKGGLRLPPITAVANQLIRTAIGMESSVPGKEVKM